MSRRGDPVPNYQKNVSLTKSVENNEDIRFEFVPLHEFVVFVYRTCSLIFHLLCDVLQETGPSRCRTKLWDVICAHLDAFVGRHNKPACGDMVNVVEVRNRCDGGKIGCRL